MVCSAYTTQKNKNLKGIWHKTCLITNILIIKKIQNKYIYIYIFVFTSNKRSISGVCLLAGVRQRLSIIKTRMKSKTNFLAG